MKGGNDRHENIQLYRYKKFHGSHAEEFLAHLNRCAACRQTLNAEEELPHSLHRLRPQYSPL